MKDPLIRQFGNIYRGKINDSWSIVYAPTTEQFILQRGSPQTEFSYHYFSKEEAVKIRKFLLRPTTILTHFGDCFNDS